MFLPTGLRNPGVATPALWTSAIPPKQPTANETETITADDGHTFTGHLVGIEQTGDYGWVDMEIPATYYGWPDVKGIFLGNLVLPTMTTSRSMRVMKRKF